MKLTTNGAVWQGFESMWNQAIDAVLDLCRMLNVRTWLRKAGAVSKRDADGVYVNATLLAQDPSLPDNLLVLSRANADRMIRSYPKGDLHVWKAMEENRRRYVPVFESAEKDYRCILALPLVVVARNGDEESIAVISVDSGQTNDFDGMDEQIETRLLPYLSLMKLLLSMRRA